MDIIGNILLGITVNGLYDDLKNIIDKRQVESIIKGLRGSVAADTLFHQQQEPFYNALDSYISRKGLVSYLIRICYDKQSADYKTRDDFARIHTDSILNRNTDFLGHKGVISRLFSDLYSHVDAAVNNCVQNQETRKIVNEITESSKVIVCDVNQYIKERIDALERQIKELPPQSKAVDLGQLPDEAAYSKYRQIIKEVVDKYQMPEMFSTAIDELNNVIQDITDNIDSLSTENRRTLLLYFYDTQAQYYANMSMLEKALQAVNRANNHKDTLDKDEYKRHYFINAYVLVQFQNEEKYNEAIPLLDKAIAIDNSYQSAIFLKFEIESLLSLVSFDEQIFRLEQYRKKHMQDADNASIADYYQTLSVVYNQNKKYETAIELLEKAEELHHSDANLVNIAISYYSWAVEGLAKNSVLLRPNIDYAKMINSLNIMSELLKNPRTLHVGLKNMLIPFYVSASRLCGERNNVISLIDLIDVANANYETRRSIILEKSHSGHLENNELETLSEIDQIIFQMGRAIDSNDIDHAIEILESAIKNYPTSETIIVYQPLLGLYLDTHNIGKYHSCLKDMKSIGLEDVYFDLHCAKIVEMEGDLQRATQLFEECITSILDTCIVFNIRAFYVRNNMKSKLIHFYDKIHDLIYSNKLRIEDPDVFYRYAMHFLISENFSMAQKILSELSIDIVGEQAYHEISIAIHSKINDHKALINSYGALYCIDNKIQNKLGQAQSYKAICEVDAAEASVHEVLERQDITSDEKSICLMLLSEIYMYKEDYERSYNCIKQCSKMNEHIPSHQSHATLLHRSMQCGKMNDGLPNAIGFKHKHPVVIDWLKEIKIPQKDDGSIDPEELLNTMHEVTGGSDTFETLLAYYRKRSFTIYHLCEFRNQTYNNVLAWHEFYKLKMRIFCGNLDIRQEEVTNIINIAVVDALTLLMLAKTNTLYLLEQFEEIHITASSVERLQSEYLSDTALLMKGFSYDAFKALVISSNFVFCPDSLEMGEKATELHFPKFLYDALMYAVEKNIPFIYADETLLQFLPYFMNQSPIMISIPSLLYKYNEIDLTHASISRHNLLSKDYQFINFDRNDVYYQIQSARYDLSSANIEPFFRCKSYHDMLSFGGVYAGVLHRLIEDNQQQCAIDYSKYVFSFLDKTAKRSKFYIQSYENPPFRTKDDLHRYQAMQRFIMYTLMHFAKQLCQYDEPYASIIEDYSFENISQVVLNELKDWIKQQKRILP